MDFSTIITVAFLAVAGLFALLMLLNHLKHNWLMALVRLAVTVVSAVAAIPVAGIISGAFSDVAYDAVLPILGDKMGGWLKAVPIGAEGMRAIATALVAPIVFILVFIVLRFVLQIVCTIIEKVLLRHMKKLRLISMPVGAIHGVLIAVILAIPISGMVVTTAHVANSFLETDGADSPVVQDMILKPLNKSADEVQDMITTVESHPVVGGIYNSVGQPVFDRLTTVQLDAREAYHDADIEMRLEDQLCDLLRTAGYGFSVVEAVQGETFTQEDKDLLLKTADSFCESEWIYYVANDTMVIMARKWQSNEEFLGLARPAMDDTMKPMFDRILNILSKETPQTLHEDIHTILDVFGDLLMNDLITENPDYEVMVQKLGESGLLNQVLDTLEANERLCVLVDELESLSIRLVGNMLGTELLESGEYDALIGDVAGTLNNALDMTEEERHEIVSSAVQNQFKDAGFVVPEDVAIKMSDKMMNDLGADGQITDEELKEYILDTSNMESILDETQNGGIKLPENLPDSLPESIPSDLVPGTLPTMP